MSSKPTAGKRTLRETRTLLGELDEATLRIDDKAYFIKDPDAKEMVARMQGEEGLEALSLSPPYEVPETKYIEAKLPPEISENLEGLPPELRSDAALVYAEYSNEIDSFRESPPSSGVSASGGIPVGWGKKMLYVAQDARKAPIGKGEVLACVMWPTSKLAGANEKGWDLEIDNKKYSVKFSSDKSPIYKLNGVIGDVIASVREELRKSGLRNIEQFIKMTLERGKGNLLQPNLARQALDCARPNESAVDYIKAYYDACDVAVKELGGKGAYEYLFFDNTKYKFHAAQDISFNAFDVEQSKVAITVQPKGKLRNAAGDEALRAIADPGEAAEVKKEAATTATESVLRDSRLLLRELFS